MKYCSIFYVKNTGCLLYTSPRERLIDPLRIATHGDQTYLLAWDIEVDGQRSYRIDKIEGLSLTEDSVERHAPSTASLHDSLSQAEQSAKLLMPLDMACLLYTSRCV